MHFTVSIEISRTSYMRVYIAAITLRGNFNTGRNWGGGGISYVHTCNVRGLWGLCTKKAFQPMPPVGLPLTSSFILEYSLIPEVLNTSCKWRRTGGGSAYLRRPEHPIYMYTFRYISRLASWKWNHEAPSFHKFQQFINRLQNYNRKWKFATRNRK